MQISVQKDHRGVIVSFSPATEQEKAFLQHIGLSYNCVISAALQVLFGRQKEFYIAFGITDEAEIERLHGRDSTFDESCDGFRLFMQKYLNTTGWKFINEANLAKITNLITTQLKVRLQSFISQTQPIRITQGIIFFPTTDEQREEKIDISIFDNALLVTNNGVYSINLIRKQAKSMDELKNELQQSMQTIYNMQLQALKNAFKVKEEEIQKQIEKAKLEGLQIGLGLKEDWKIENGYCVYKHIIYANKVQSNGEIHYLTDEKKFYIRGLKVPLNLIVNKAYCEKSYHPNASRGEVCIGDLTGKSIFEVLEKLPETLKTANLDSAYPNDATQELREDFEELTSSGAGEIWNVEGGG